jgi:hypothetical protein
LLVDEEAKLKKYDKDHKKKQQCRAATTGPAISAHLLYKPMIPALAKVLKCRLKPTTAPDVSEVTLSLSTFTATR